jgi:hypothetical protein
MGMKVGKKNGGVMLPPSQRLLLRCFKLQINFSMIYKHCGQDWVLDEH